MLCTFQLPTTNHQFRNLYYKMTVLLPPPKFMCLPCYYPLQEIKKYETRIASTGIISVSNFVRIQPEVLQLKQAKRNIVPVCIHFTYIMQRTCNNTHTLPKHLSSKVLKITELQLPIDKLYL
jgi:hypothetical protein